MDTSQLESLQNCANDLAHRRVVKFVFVDSGGLAVRSLRQRAGRWARMVEIDVPDVTEHQAKQFLQQALSMTNISVSRTYEELTGGRLELLHLVRYVSEYGNPHVRRPVF